MNHLTYPVLQRTDMRLDAFLFACSLAILLRGPYRARLLQVLTAAWFRVLSIVILFAVWTWTVAGSAPAIGTLAESVLLPCILVSVIHWRGSWVFQALESAPLRWMGRISYGLYLWQQLFLVGHSVNTLPGAAGIFLPGLVLTFAAATASYYLLERPLLNYGREYSRRVRTAVPRAQTELEPSSIMEQ